MSSKINSYSENMNHVEKTRWRRRLIEGAVIELRMLRTCVKLRLDTAITKQVYKDQGDEGVRALRRGELKLANTLWITHEYPREVEMLSLMVMPDNSVRVSDKDGYVFIIKNEDVMYSEIDPDWRLS